MAVLLVLHCSFIYGQVLDISTAEFPPLTSTTPLGSKGYGLYRDLSEAIAQEAGYSANFFFKPFKRMAIEFAKIDDIVLTSRKTLTGFGHPSDSYYSISLGFFYSHYFYFKSHLGDNLIYAGLTDLRPYNVCLPLGSFALEPLKQAGVTVHNVVNIQQCLKKLVFKRDDVWGSTALTAYYYTEKLFPEKLNDLAHTPVDDTSSDEVILALIKTPENKKVSGRLTKAYQTLKDNGTILNIIQRYWNNKAPQRVLPLDMQRQ